MGARFRGALVVLVLLGPALASAPTRATAQTVTTAADIQRLEDSANALDAAIGRLQEQDTRLASALAGSLASLRDDITYLKVKLRKEGSVTRVEFLAVQDRLEALERRAAAPSRLNVPITSEDVQRLEASAAAVDAEIASLRVKDARLAGELADELASLREEIIYLKVRLRREGTVAPADFLAVQDRLEALRARAAGTKTASTAGRLVEVPVGTELDVRLQTPLSSKTAKVEDRFEATTATDLQSGETVLIPAGALMRGVVSAVSKATRLNRKGSLALRFTEISIDGMTYPANATLTQVLESEGIKGEAGRIGTGAGVGGVIGGILGGIRGVLTGILIGAGGTIAATTGTDVELTPGAILRVRIDSPILLR